MSSPVEAVESAAVVEHASYPALLTYITVCAPRGYLNTAFMGLLVGPVRVDEQLRQKHA